MSQEPKTERERMEAIVSLCKRRGFIFQSSEIYGGLNGCWDYGPMGVELKKNLKDYWWCVMTRERDDIVGLDGSILMNRRVWQASGHEGTFSDPMVDCRVTKRRFRADQIDAQDGTILHFTGANDPASGRHIEKAFSVLLQKGKHVESARKIAKHFYAQGTPAEFTDQGAGFELLGEVGEAVSGTTAYNPENGAELTEAREFNLMFKTFVGATEDENSIAYLRPETAQAIFVQFKNVLDTARKKLPFGIAQIGKAFRNEINPRNFIFRSREFEQMELEYFCKPDQGRELLDYWLEERLKFYEAIGIPRSKLHVLDVPANERAHYSQGTYDIEYDFPFGKQELEGVAYRTDHDLKSHMDASGKPFEYFDEETRERYIPHVVEPSAGADRTVLALLCEAYAEETVTDEKGKAETRVVLRFTPRMAPVKVGIFPLMKNNPQIVEQAKAIAASLRSHMLVQYDEAGAIGRRYRRQDEIGTPFCVTVDFDTIGENGPDNAGTVTLRHRDSMQQERVPIEVLAARLIEAIR